MKFFVFPIFLVALARAQNDAYVRIAARSNSIELTDFVDAIVDFNDANGLRVDDLMTEDSFEEDAEEGAGEGANDNYLNWFKIRSLICFLL